MKIFRLAVPAAILCSGLLITLTPSYGKPELTKKEKKPCVTCHVSAKSKDLNDVGKCYKEKATLAGCESAKPAQ